MEQSSSWEAESHTANQDISRILWGPKVDYSVHMSKFWVILIESTPQIQFPQDTL